MKTYYASTAALPLPGRLATVVYPGGKTETYSYEYGVLNASTFVFTPDADGGAWRETVTTEYADDGGAVSPKPPQVQAMRSIRVWDEKGREVLNESYVEDGAAFARIGWKRMTYDRNGKLIETAYSDGRVESATWGANCCGKESETSAEGIVTVYGYNELKQKVSETKKGMAADGSDDIATLYTYDLENRVRSTVVTNISSGLGYVASHRAYDAVGRMTNAVDRLGNPSFSIYDVLATTVLRPNGVAAVSERHLDLHTKRVLENAVVKQSYAFGISADGTQWTLSADGPLPAIDFLADVAGLWPLASGLDFPWQLQTFDSLGRNIATYKPAFGGAILVTSNTYDIADSLLSTTQYAFQLLNSSSSILSAPMLYSYAVDGSLFLTVQDLNSNGVIDLVGPDRVTGYSSAYEKDVSNVWWQVSRSWVYPKLYDSAAVTTSVQRILLSGLGVQQGDDDILATYSESLDVRGNVTVSKVLLNRTAKAVTQFSLSPTSVHPSIQAMVNGLLTSAVSSTAVTNTYFYDALGRQTAVTDGRGNTSITAYNAIGQVLYTEDASSKRTSYAYDTLGHRTEMSDPLGNVAHTRYDAEGRVIATWGSTYPVAYTYDNQGRVVQMGTYRGTTEITDYASFQSLVFSFDKTHWLYDQPTGLLTNKLYADGKGPSYTYTLVGRLASRTWARLDSGTGEKLYTLYSYDTEGSLLGIDYSDETPDIAYTYDRLGNVATVIDASGAHVFSHAPDGQILNDTVLFQNEVFTLHEAYDAQGRNTGYTLSNSVDGTASLITGTGQGYDALGRISDVSIAGVPAPFRYGWVPCSDLHQTLAMPNGVTRQTTYDPHRDLLASVTHTNTVGTILTRRTFAYDTSGRMTSRTQYRLGDETNRPDDFGYNPRSELISAALGTNAYAYAFDPTGNRMTDSELNASSVYSANALNQYSVISNFVSSELTCEFLPVFDADGNQTRIRTSTGIWNVTYNAENRPYIFSNGTTVVEMSYDYKGRRFSYKETINGVDTRRERYLYRNYLQIAAFSLMNSLTLVHAITWDPTEPVATRPLCLQTINDQHQTNCCFYSFDQVKNVVELFDGAGQITATYDYAPFGSVIAMSGAAADVNPLTFSSEVCDVILGLSCYNWRYLNVVDGQWLSRDPICELAFDHTVLQTPKKERVFHQSSFDELTEENELDDYIEFEFAPDLNDNVISFQYGSSSISHDFVLVYAFAKNAPTTYSDLLGLEHRKETPCKWDKHSKPRPGRDCEKKKQKPGWRPRDPKKFKDKACVAGAIVIITWIVTCDPIPGDELAWGCCLIYLGSQPTDEKCCCP